jgi:hypothetical protein
MGKKQNSGPAKASGQTVQHIPGRYNVLFFAKGENPKETSAKPTGGLLNLPKERVLALVDKTLEKGGSMCAMLNLKL